MKNTTYLLVLISFFISTYTARSQTDSVNITQQEDEYKWDRFSISLGGFSTSLDNNIIIGIDKAGLGASINLEDALGLSTTNTIFRSGAEFHYGKQLRNTLRAGYYGFFRKATKVVDSEIIIGDQIFPIGTEITSNFDFQIIRAAYDYSFYIDNRVKLGASAGLFIMPISFHVSAIGTSESATEFIAPLPVFGLRSDFAITPDIHLKQSIEVLYMKVGDFTGSISDINIGLEYTPFKNFGFGIGYNAYKLNISIKKDTKQWLDFIGSIRSEYSGMFFYGCYSF